MKRSYFLIYCLMLAALCKSQVGINTLQPQGVFHIDPAGNSSGVNNVSDDLIVDSNGNTGIGILDPKAKLHINTSGTTPFIRIEDPSEEASEGKYLMSDATGAGSWIPKTKLSGKVYRTTSPQQAVTIYKAGVDSPVLFSKVKLDDGSFIDNNDGGYVKVDTDGNYIFTLRWFGSVTKDLVKVADLKGVFFDELLAEIKVRKIVAGVIQPQDLDHALVAVARARSYTVTSRYTFIVSLFVPNAKKGDTYTVMVKPSARIGDDWEVGMGLNASVGQFDNIIYFPSLTIYNI